MKFAGWKVTEKFYDAYFYAYLQMPVYLAEHVYRLSVT